MSDSTTPGAIPPPHQPRHRREGVPLDGAPDLGLFTSPVVSQPLSPANWAVAPQVGPSPVPPELPAPSTPSQYRPDPDTGNAG